MAQVGEWRRAANRNRARHCGDRIPRRYTPPAVPECGYHIAIEVVQQCPGTVLSFRIIGAGAALCRVGRGRQFRSRPSLRLWREVHGQSSVKLFGSYLSVEQAMNRSGCTPVRSVPAAMNRGRADIDAAKLKILVIATQKTVLAARISMALADVRFRVADLTPRGHPAGGCA